MGRAGGVPPRPEDGKRDSAELLHSQMNTTLNCPTCGYHDSQRGAFNKDVAGKADVDGRRYRRFVCRSHPSCGRSISATDFIKLCNNTHHTKSGYDCVAGVVSLLLHKASPIASRHLAEPSFNKIYRCIPYQITNCCMISPSLIEVVILPSLKVPLLLQGKRKVCNTSIYIV